MDTSKSIVDLQFKLNYEPMHNSTSKQSHKKESTRLLGLLMLFLFFNFGATIFAQGISTGVTFNWADSQSNISDPATIESIDIDGKLYDTFVVPSAYEMTRVGNGGHDGNNIWLNGSKTAASSADPSWNSKAISAYQDLNLNHYFESEDNGDNFCENFGAATTTDSQIQTISFNPGIPSNPDGILGVTERGGNNCQYLELYGIPPGGTTEQLLGATFVRNQGNLTGVKPQAPPQSNSDYWSSGRNNENNQIIGIALFELSDIAPIGSTITAIKYFAATRDNGDGKFFLMQSYAVDDFFESDFDEVFTGDVSTNDNVPNNSVYTYFSSVPPFNGTLVVNPNGSFSYTPNPGFVGTDVFEVQVCLPAPNNTVCNVSTVTMTVKPNPSRLSIDDTSAQEGDNLSFTITNSVPVNNAIIIDLNYSNITTTNLDYSGPTTVTLPANASSVSFNISALDDNLIEPTETFEVQISTSTAINIDDNTGIGTIFDNDGGTGTGISFDSTDVVVNEDAGTATFSVSLTGNVPGGFTLDYATADGSAIAPGDYTATSGQLTFLGNDGESFDIIVPIIDDLLIEATEGYTVNLSNLSTTLIAINTPSANGGIIDNDGGVGTGISFDATDVVVNEDAGTATFSVSLTGNVPGGFTLDYATADGSAIAPGDYTATSGQLTFLGNDGESFDIIVPIIDDLLIEATEGYTVNLSNLSTTLIAINTPSANGGINDNDGGTGTGISFDNTDVVVNEDAGTATFTVSLTGNVPGGFTLDYATADGSAIAPGDYTATSGQLTFLGTDGESFDIVVPIIDDLLIEATEGYTVNLSNLSTTLIAINTPSANGGINDNDGGTGTGISFDSTDVVVNEDAGTATFTVSLTGNVPGGFTLDYVTADGSAIAPGDYTNTNGQLTFLGNDGESFDIIVPIIDDLLIEATEGYTVNLSNLSTTLIAINTPSANGGINDNDGGTGTGISFDSTDVVVNEDAGTATFTVSLTGNVPGGFTLDYATADGSAVAPDDYTTTSGQLTFLGTDGESFDIVVPIIDDLLIEATEGYTVNLSNLSTTLIAINTPQANGGINDNDGGTGTGISFDNTDIVVNEDAGTATFTVSLTGNVPGGFTLDYATTDGSAVAPGDYSTTNGQLTFLGTDGESFDIVVPIIDDLLIEATEGYTVNLSNLSTTLIAINTPSANGGINDNDGGTGTGISFDNTDVVVNEDAGTATFTVSLTGNVPGGFTLDYATADGSAVAPDDYTTTSGQLTFLGNDGESFDIVVPIIDDLLIEATEGYTVNLSNLSTTLIAINTPSANGGIIDNDGGTGTGISFDATDVVVNEDAGTATFTVSLTGNVPGGFTLDYATADGSAVAPGDYTATSGQLTFLGTDGESFDIIVPIIDDLLIEATEGYTVNLSNLSTTLIAINTPSANGGINDNDGGTGTGISFDNTDVVVNEDAGTATFTVSLTGNVPGGFTLDYATADGSAISPGDYTTTNGQLTFLGNDGESFDILVPIIDDLLIEATEGYSVNLSNLSTTLIAINTPQANGGINDNDGGTGTGISFDNTDVVVNEDAGTATFTVSLTGNVPGGFTLDYATADGSAVAPGDYTTTNGQLTFLGNDGESFDIVVPIIDDLLIEANEGYTVNLSNLSTTVILINTPEANGSIIDNDMRMIISSDYTKEYMLTCGEEIPEVPELTFTGGCGDYQVDFTEVEEASDTSGDFMIVRTWNVTDACGNTASFEQIIFVMQLEEELITIDICVADESIDLITFLPENFDTNGTFTITQGVALLDGNFFDPKDLELGEYIVSYSSTVGSCTYIAEFTINVNADCVECSEEDVIVSKALTPNGDGINDLFTISGAENCFFTYDVMIFNRWGNKVYEAIEYQNDWNGSSPDGSFGSNGNLPSGTYYYIINISNRLDLKPINGYIYLGTK